MARIWIERTQARTLPLRPMIKDNRDRLGHLSFATLRVTTVPLGEGSRTQPSINIWKPTR